MEGEKAPCSAVALGVRPDHGSRLPEEKKMREAASMCSPPYLWRHAEQVDDYVSDTQVVRYIVRCDVYLLCYHSSMIHSGRGVVPQPPRSMGIWQYSMDAWRSKGEYQNISFEPPYCPIDCTISVQHW